MGWWQNQASRALKSQYADPTPWQERGKEGLGGKDLSAVLRKT